MEIIRGLLEPGGLIKAFFVGVGLMVTWIWIDWFRSLLNAKKKAEVLEIDLMLREIRERNSKLSDDELLKRANQRPKPPQSG